MSANAIIVSVVHNIEYVQKHLIYWAVFVVYMVIVGWKGCFRLMCNIKNFFLNVFKNSLFQTRWKDILKKRGGYKVKPRLVHERGKEINKLSSLLQKSHIFFDRQHQHDQDTT